MTSPFYRLFICRYHLWICMDWKIQPMSMLIISSEFRKISALLIVYQSYWLHWQKVTDNSIIFPGWWNENRAINHFIAQRCSLSECQCRPQCRQRRGWRGCCCSRPRSPPPRPSWPPASRWQHSTIVLGTIARNNFFCKQYIYCLYISGIMLRKYTWENWIWWSIYFMTIFCII